MGASKLQACGSRGEDVEGSYYQNAVQIGESHRSPSMVYSSRIGSVHKLETRTLCRVSPSSGKGNHVTIRVMESLRKSESPPVLCIVTWPYIFVGVLTGDW